MSVAEVEAALTRQVTINKSGGFQGRSLVALEKDRREDLAMAQFYQEIEGRACLENITWGVFNYRQLPGLTVSEHD